MSKMFSLSAAVLLLTVCGCIWGGQSRETRFFDLRTNQKKNACLPCEINFMLFRNLSGSDRRFLLRHSGNRLQSDEFNRWLLDPELILERFLREEVQGKGKTTVRVRGVITAFEIDTLRQEAVLAVDFILSSGENTRRLSCRASRKITPENGDFSAGAAAAMNFCALRIAENLRGGITDLLKAAPAAAE